MNPPSEPLRKYADAEGYDAYMGGWGAALSPIFTRFARITNGASVLDVGCGTGNLLAAVRAEHPAAILTGIDPSVSLLDKAKSRPELTGATLLQGTVEHLPFEAKRFDSVVSMLVLQECSDRPRALGEVRRVTRPGGIVAACQWDFARMPVIEALVAGIMTVNDTAGSRVWANSPPVFEDEAELADWWRRSGLGDVTTGRLSVTRTFPTFADLWLPLLAGTTPSTLVLVSLPTAEQDEVQEIIQRRFVTGGRVAPITAEALVVRGHAQASSSRSIEWSSWH